AIGVIALALSIGAKNADRGDLSESLIARFAAAQLFFGPFLRGDVRIGAEVTVKLAIGSKNGRAEDDDLPAAAALAEDFHLVTRGHAVAPLVLLAHDGVPALGGEEGLV